MEEIFVQIPKLVDRETNVRGNCSMVLRGNKILLGSFWPYFRRYRDDNFVDRATNAWKKFLFKFQNSSIERQTFVEIIPWFCVETNFFLVVFVHIFIVIGMATLMIARQNVENELKKSISRPPYRRQVVTSFRLYIDGL